MVSSSPGAPRNNESTCELNTDNFLLYPHHFIRNTILIKLIHIRFLSTNSKPTGQRWAKSPPPAPVRLSPVCVMPSASKFPKKTVPYIEPYCIRLSRSSHLCADTLRAVERVDSLSVSCYRYNIYRYNPTPWPHALPILTQQNSFTFSGLICLVVGETLWPEPEDTPV